MAVHYYEQGVRARLKDKRKLSAFIRQLVSRELDNRPLSIAYIFCSDESLLAQNIRFLNHDTLTDIITFDLSADETELLSEIYISIDRVQENAIKFNVPYITELHRVIFHGVLHLCGYKDKKKSDKVLMTEMENHCLRQYFDET